jgi:hypothetical protein
MKLDLTDQQTEALTRELSLIVENDKYPILASRPNAAGNYKMRPEPPAANRAKSGR